MHKIGCVLPPNQSVVFFWNLGMMSQQQMGRPSPPQSNRADQTNLVNTSPVGETLMKK